jgi:hypothetical protein
VMAGEDEKQEGASTMGSLRSGGDEDDNRKRKDWSCGANSCGSVERIHGE